MLISERIYQYLEEKGMSQIEFAKRTGISQSTVSDWRRKGTNPSADKIMIQVIAKLLRKLEAKQGKFVQGRSFGMKSG